MKYILFGMLVCLVSSSCSKKDDDPKVPDIFVAGAMSDASGFNNVAGYWKNGQWQQLAKLGSMSQVFAIAVSGNTVACAGVLTYNNNTTRMAVCWKNGQIDTLNATGQALGATILNDDIYIAGIVVRTSTFDYKACYWKNGQQFILPFTDTAGIANAICNSGDNFYIAGGETNAAGIVSAEYWINGVLHKIETSGTGESDIFVVNNDVYMAGTMHNNATGHNMAGYWKNGTWFAINDGEKVSNTGKMTISEGDVFITGKYGEEAGYWKNTQWNPIPDAFTTTAIAVYDGDVYISGSRNIGEAGYWKNGNWNSLGTGAVYDIVVQ